MRIRNQLPGDVSPRAKNVIVSLSQGEETRWRKDVVGSHYEMSGSVV